MQIDPTTSMTLNIVALVLSVIAVASWWGDLVGNRTAVIVTGIMNTVVSASTVSLFTAAGAQAAPWCALYSTGFNDCHSFYSFEQCMASISGVGGAIQLVMVPILIFGMGRFDVQQTHSTLTWVAFVLYSVAVVGFLFLLLRDIWKPNA